MSVGEDWSGHFGLAPVPLFACEDQDGNRHQVLLDGGLGSFAFSEAQDRIWRNPTAATWAWSAGVPHHVTVTKNEVAVVRWDRPGAEEFSLSSVQAGLDAFYAYLVADRVRSTRRVVEHLVDVFRRTRSLLRDEGVDDLRSVQAYLGILSDAIARTSGREVVPANTDLAGAFPTRGREALIEQVANVPGASGLRSDLSLLPELAVRHAGSEVFQEAHFALVSGGERDLFDMFSPAVSKANSRGTSHFTPAALARSLCEQTLRELGDARGLDTLTILDPACGSGSFLYEAVRTLRRQGFDGALRLVGRDLSPAAVDMARFTIAFAAADWKPAGGLIADIETADALEGTLPTSDVVLMNPPFLAWSSMDPAERERMKRVLGNAAKGRIDLSMAFVERGLNALRPGGVVGSILPASVLASSAAEAWRNSLTDRADLRMIASLGEYGLFSHALVTVAALVARRHGSAQASKGEVLAVISGRTADATGDALRAIRRDGAVPSAFRSDARWEMFRVPQAAFEHAPTWRPMSPEVLEGLSRLEALGVTKPIGRVFKVLQGARTGWVQGFVLDEAELAALPAGERRWFPPAAMGDNIVDGRLIHGPHVFFPYGPDRERLPDLESVERNLPGYFERLLRPNEGLLRKRATHKGRDDWWTLGRPRSWNVSDAPRIVSKYFGGPGGFALDAEGEFVVVQGFAWFLRQTALPGDALSDDDDEGAYDDSLTPIEELDDVAMPRLDLLASYVALFNSKTFERLLATFSSHVSGGQYDLSARFTNRIPVPDFDTLWTRDGRAPEIARLVELGRNPQPGGSDWDGETDYILSLFYGRELLERI